MKIKDIKLISPKDEQYIHYIDKLMLEKFHLRDSLETGAINEISIIFEKFIQEYYSQNVECSDSRILHYKLLKAHRGYSNCFRELDVVIGKSKHPRIIVEIKVTTNVDKMIKKATKQISYSHKLMKPQWLDITPVVVIVALGDGQESEEWNISSLNKILNIPCQTINSIQDIQVIVVGYKELWEFGESIGLTKGKEKLFKSAVKEANVLIGNRNRIKILIENKVSREDWPLDLVAKNSPQLPELKIYTSGSDGMNELQYKLSQALNIKID